MADPLAAISAAKSDHVPGLPFALTYNLGKLLPPEFVYDLDPITHELKMGDKVVQTGNFRLQFQNRKSSTKLVFSWPASFLTDGHLRIEVQKHSVFNAPITSDSTKKTGDLLSWTSDDLDSDTLSSLVKSPTFRFCFGKSYTDYELRFCSEPLRLVKSAKGYAVLAQPLNLRETTRVNGDLVTSRGIVSFNSIKKINFQATLSTGAQYLIDSRPGDLTIFDIIQKKDGWIQIKGTGGPPTGPKVRLLKNGEWQTLLNPQNPRLEFEGAGKIPFISDVYLTGVPLPKAEERVRLDARSKYSTYLSQLTLKGTGPREFKLLTLKSRLIPVKSASAGRQSFKWNIFNLKPGMENKRLMELKGNPPQEYLTQTKIYRGYQWEGAGKISAALGQNGSPAALLTARVGYSPEHLFNSRNYWLGDQRWNFDMSYFSEVGDITPISLLRLNAKYRFSPGVHFHDSTFGVLAEANQAQVEGLNANLIGAGVFAEYPMFKTVDHVLDLVSFLRYPKWLTASAVYYPLPIFSSKVTGYTARASLDAEMFVTKQFYVSAGFSIYDLNLDFNRNTASESRLDLIYSYDTLGIGYDF